MSERACLNCRSDISHRDARAKYCSEKCLYAPRFYGTYCDWCKKELFVARGNLKLTKFCSKRCYFLSLQPELNEDYFAVPNLENSYWAGFIAADGCISLKEGGRNNELAIVLKQTDLSHLEEFRSSIGGGRIYIGSVFDSRTQKKYHRADYRLASSKVCDDLAVNYNIHPRKSLVHKPPELSDDLAYAFIAGYIDGDGSYTHGSNRPRLSIVGTKEFLFWISSICEIYKTPLAKPNEKIFYIEFGGDDAISVRALFEDLGLPLLERKRNRWEELGLNLKTKGKI